MLKRILLAAGLSIFVAGGAFTGTTTPASAAIICIDSFCVVGHHHHYHPWGPWRPWRHHHGHHRHWRWHRHHHHHRWWQ